MSDVLQAPVERRTETTRITHWIGGRAAPGESGRSGPVYNPATGRQTGAVAVPFTPHRALLPHSCTRARAP
jgi:hypothetical protein